MSAFAADFRAGTDINLGVGYVNENTIPRQLIQSAMQAVLADPARYKTALNYGGPQGSPNLINSLRSYLLRNAIGGLTPEVLDRQEVLIGSNGATSLLEALAMVITPGIVLTSDPMYYIYCNFLERMGYKVVTIPEDSGGIRIDLLERKLQGPGFPLEDLRFFYIVTINNPTATILTNQRRAQLVEITSRVSHRLGRKVPLVLDGAYEGLVHDPAVPPLVSALSLDPDGVVFELGTLSKIVAPALRAGYIIGQPCPLLQAVVQKTSDAGFSAPLINQEIAAWILDHHIEEQAARVNRGYREKARAIRVWIDQYLGAYLENCTGGQAGFYFYLTLNIETGEKSPFFRYLTRTTGLPGVDREGDQLKPRVIYIPGEFCVHPRGPLRQTGRRQLRISYGFEDLAGIETALQHMQAAAEYAAGQA